MTVILSHVQGFKMHWNNRRKQLPEVDGKNVETYMCSKRNEKNGIEVLYVFVRFVLIKLKLETFAQFLPYINLSETMKFTMFWV